MSTPTKQPLLDHLREEIARLKRDVGVDADTAFCHFVLQTVYDLDDEDAADACGFDVTDSQRADAFWHDADGERVVLAETYFRSGGNTRVDPRAIVNLTRAWAALDPRCEESGAPELSETAEAFRQALGTSESVTVELVYATTGSFVDAAHAYARDFNEEHAGLQVKLRLIQGEDLVQADLERRSRDAPPPAEGIELKLREWFEESGEDGRPPTLVASIDGAQLAELEQKYHFSIFQRNVRYQVPGKINKNIESTLKRADGRRNFWYYNNGISIVCDSYEFPNKKRASVLIYNLQIVNGCQTTTTLGANAKELSDPAPLGAGTDHRLS